MAKFLVVHPVGKEMSLEALTPLGKAVKAIHTTEAYWVKSIYAQEEGKVYCEWDAKDAESISQILSKTAPDLPTEGIYKIEFVADSEDYR